MKLPGASTALPWSELTITFKGNNCIFTLTNKLLLLHRSSTESEAKSNTDSGSDCAPDKPIRWCGCDDKNAQINQISSTNTMTKRVNTVRKSMAQPSTTDSIDCEAAPQPARNDPFNP